MARPELLAFMAQESLTVESVFVPFSQSRNAKPKGKDAKGLPCKPWLSLNWKCTLKQADKLIMEDIDYSAGTYRCKSPKNRIKHYYEACIAKEIETGYPHHYWESFNRASIVAGKPKQAMPDPCDVLYSIASDSDVLDSSTYEDWAESVGYSPDSREGEAIYRTCLAIALKLRNALGEHTLTRLREACQDY